jgi:hypothetical protein
MSPAALWRPPLSSVAHPPPQVAIYAYVHVLLDAQSIPQVSPFASLWLDNWLVVNPQSVVEDITPWSIRLASAQFPSIGTQNFTITAYSNPTGPFARGLAGVPIARYCWDEAGAGPPVDPESLAVNRTLWVLLCSAVLACCVVHCFAAQHGPFVVVASYTVCASALLLTQLTGPD